LRPIIKQIQVVRHFRLFNCNKFYVLWQYCPTTKYKRSQILTHFTYIANEWKLLPNQLQLQQRITLHSVLFFVRLLWFRVCSINWRLRKVICLSGWVPLLLRFGNQRFQVDGQVVGHLYWTNYFRLFNFKGKNGRNIYWILKDSLRL